MYKKILNYFVIMAVALFTMAPMASCGNDDPMASCGNDDDENNLEDSWSNGDDKVDNKPNEDGEDNGQDERQDEGEANVTPNVNDITGRWHLTYEIGWEKENGEIIQSWKHDDSIFRIYYNFYSDSTYKLEYQGDIEEGPFTLTDGKMTLGGHYYDVIVSGNTLKTIEHIEEETFELYEELTYTRVN